MRILAGPVRARRYGTLVVQDRLPRGGLQGARSAGKRDLARGGACVEGPIVSLLANRSLMLI